MKTTNPIKPLLACLLGAFVATYAFADNAQREATKLRMTEGKALFEEKCRTVAGEKIYKTVPEVEGVLLMKVRPNRTDRELADPMWPGAAFGREAEGNSYINSFLGYEHSPAAEGKPVWPQRRGYINTDKRPGSLPGYRWVEVIDPKDGQRYRFSGSVKPSGKKNPQAYKAELENDPHYDLNIYRWSLDKVPSPSKTQPRYAVTFEDHVIPEERALWVASSTVKVLDLQTNEVLGEMTRYAMSYIHAPRHSMPWLNYSVCPATGGDAHANTRQFVDQILIPKKED